MSKKYGRFSQPPVPVQNEVMDEVTAKGRGWERVEDGYYSHDEYGMAIRQGGYRDSTQHRGGHWMLHPPAVGMSVDITEPYAGPYKSAKAAMLAAEAFFPGSDWERAIAKGGGYHEWEYAATGTSIPQLVAMEGQIDE